MLGHADITTTASHYLESKEKPVLSLLTPKSLLIA